MFKYIIFLNRTRWYSRTKTFELMCHLATSAVLSCTKTQSSNLTLYAIPYNWNTHLVRQLSCADSRLVRKKTLCTEKINQYEQWLEELWCAKHGVILNRLIEPVRNYFFIFSQENSKRISIQKTQRTPWCFYWHWSARILQSATDHQQVLSTEVLTKHQSKAHRRIRKIFFTFSDWMIPTEMTLLF